MITAAQTIAISEIDFWALMAVFMGAGVLMGRPDLVERFMDRVNRIRLRPLRVRLVPRQGPPRLFDQDTV